MEEQRRNIRNELKESLEFAPFAIAGRFIADIERHIEAEYSVQRTIVNKDILKKKIDWIISSLENDSNNLAFIKDKEVHKFYISRVREL